MCMNIISWSSHVTQTAATKAIVKRRERLLKSYSTPVLGSLLPCFSDSSNNLSDATIKHPTTTIHQAHNMLLLHQTGSLKLSLISCNSSPISPSVNVGHRGFWKAQFDGNLKGLAYASCNNKDEFSSTWNLPKEICGDPVAHCCRLYHLSHFIV